MTPGETVAAAVRALDEQRVDIGVELGLVLSSILRAPRGPSERRAGLVLAEAVLADARKWTPRRSRIRPHPDTDRCACGHTHETTLGPCTAGECARFRPLLVDDPEVIAERVEVLLAAVDACPHRFQDLTDDEDLIDHPTERTA